MNSVGAQAHPHFAPITVLGAAPGLPTFWASVLARPPRLSRLLLAKWNQPLSWCGPDWKCPLTLGGWRGRCVSARGLAFLGGGLGEEVTPFFCWRWGFLERVPLPLPYSPSPDCLVQTDQLQRLTLATHNPQDLNKNPQRSGVVSLEWQIGLELGWWLEEKWVWTRRLGVEEVIERDFLWESWKLVCRVLEESGGVWNRVMLLNPGLNEKFGGKWSRNSWIDSGVGGSHRIGMTGAPLGIGKYRWLFKLALSIIQQERWLQWFSWVQWIKIADRKVIHAWAFPLDRHSRFKTERIHKGYPVTEFWDCLIVSLISV